MSFTDNPVIATLGNQLGMGDMFAQMRGEASQSNQVAENAPPTAPGKSQAAPTNVDRRQQPYIPRNEQGTTGRGVGPGGSNPIQPGPMSQETLQDPKVQTLLGQYGVTPSSTPPDPNLFVHNPEAFQKHPILAALLERGLGGLAYSHPGNNFFESLTGGLRGNQEYDAARTSKVNNQLMAPIQQAQAIGSLQHLSDEHATSEADIKYKQGMADYYKSVASSKEEKASQVPPRKNEDGSWSTWNPDARNGEGDYEVNPNMGRDEETYQKNLYFSGAAHAIAVDKHGGDISKITPEEYAAIHQRFETMQSLAKGAAGLQEGAGHDRARVTASGITHNGSAANGKLTDVQKAQLNDLTKEEGDINTTLQGVKGKQLVFDDDRNPLVPGSPKTKAYVASKTQRLADIRAAKAKLMGLTPAQVPLTNPVPFTQAPSNSNPFRK